MKNRNWLLILFWLHTLLFCNVITVWGQTFHPTRESPPRLAVFPFYVDKDPDYGVFMADRLIDELLQYRDVPAMQGRWFELVEPDTLPRETVLKLLATQQALEEDQLLLLQSAANADYVLLGQAVFLGTRMLQVRIVDLKDGEIVWGGNANDDVKWQWIYQQKRVGEIAIGNLASQLGFKLSGRRGSVLLPEELPLRVGIAPLQSTQRALVGGYDRLIREAIDRQGIWDELKTVSQSGARYMQDDRGAVAVNQNIDAVLCGSLMATGKDNAVNTVAVALRLIAIPSGRILWAGSADAQRIWRKDEFDELSQSIAEDLSINLVQAYAGAQIDTWADMPEPEDGPGWLHLGIMALERGALERAEDAFLNAEKFEATRARAYEGLGQLFARRPAFRQRAVTYFQQAIQADSARADLYYELASVYFDIGTGQCVEMAQRAIDIDSTYSAPYRILGDWFARDDWYARPEDNEYAAIYYSRYLDLEPDDEAVVTRLGGVLLRLEDHRTIERKIIPFIANHPTAIDLLPVAAQWAYRTARYEDAATYWKQYLKLVDEQTRGLYHNPEVILSKRQRQHYLRISPDQRQQYIESYWANRDIDQTTAVNERLLEHYQRVWIARQYFSDSAFPWDYRGEVYLRYGEPDYRSRSGRAPGVMSAAVQQVKDRLYAELYNTVPDGALVGTVFPVRSSRAMMAEENFGVTMDNADTFTQGDAFLPVTSGEDHSLVPWESWVYVTVGDGIEITFTDEMGSGHFNFAPTPMRQLPGMRSITRIQEHAPEIVFESAVSETPEQHRPWLQTRDLDFYYSIADALGDQGQTRLDVAFGLPLNREGEGGGDVTLAIALHDSVANQTYRMSKRVSMNVDQVVDYAMLTDLLTLQTAPGTYQLTVKAENASANRVSVYAQNIEVENYKVSTLAMSDLVLAANIEDAQSDGSFRRHDLKVVPLPTQTFLEGQDLGLYFEVYNLQPDSFGQMKYRVTIKVLARGDDGGLMSLFLGNQITPEISLTFEQIVSDTHIPVYQFIDLGASKFGSNQLEVLIEDLNSGQSVNKATLFRYQGREE